MIRIKHVNHARNPRLSSPSPRVTRKTDRSRRRTMIRAVAGYDLVTSGEEAGNLDGVLVGVSAAVGEEECVDVSRSNLGQLRAQPRAHFRSHERIRIGQRCRLLADRMDEALVAVSDVDGHELAIEVDEALAFRRVEIYPLGASHRNRVNLRLRRPF